MIKTVNSFLDGKSEKIKFFSNDYFIDSSIIGVRLSMLRNEIAGLFGQLGTNLHPLKEQSMLSWINRKKAEIKEFYSHRGLVVVIADIHPVIRYAGNNGAILIDLLMIFCNDEVSLNYKENVGKELILNQSFRQVFASQSVKFAFTFSEATSSVKILATTLKSKEGVAFSLGMGAGDLVVFPNVEYTTPEVDLEKNIFESVKKIVATQKGDLEHVVSNPPEWIKEFDLPKQKLHDDSLTLLKKNKKEIEDQIEQERQSLLNYNVFKSILYTSGTHLEKGIGKCFEHLGINHSYPDGSDTDMIIQEDGLFFAIEIKGVSGSASKQYTRQLEDWVNACATKYEIDDVKGLLIINAFNNKPLSERTDMVFPPNVLEYSEPRKHCLLTTTTLLTIIKNFDNGKINRDEILNLLNSTVGVLEYDEKKVKVNAGGKKH